MVAREGELARPMPGIDWESIRLGLEFRQGKGSKTRLSTMTGWTERSLS